MFVIFKPFPYIITLQLKTAAEKSLFSKKDDSRQVISAILQGTALNMYILLFFDREIPGHSDQ